MKKYKLLKDLPYAKAWAIYEEQTDWTYKTNDIVLSALKQDTLHELVLTKTPEWFEEVKENKVEEYINKIDWNKFSTLISTVRHYIKDNGKEEVIDLLHKLVGQTYNPLDAIKQIQENYIIIKI